MTIDEIKAISIKDYLGSMSIYPIKNYGYYGMYKSPFRNEHTPSFKVDYNQNLWYDFALDEGGSLIDLVMKLHNCSLVQAIELFNGKQNNLPKFSIANSKTISPNQSRIEVIGSTNLCHPNLIDYFTHRGINLNIAKKYCREMHYRIGDRSFYAIGFPNNSYGYALRNPYFKGCLPPSDVSYVPNPSEQINLFEGFIDYLSLLTMSPEEEKKAALILNSINNIKKSRFFLSKHKLTCSYLDNDEGGKRTLEQLKRDGFDVQDCSSVFQNYKDLNEYLCAEFKHSEKAENKKTKGIKL